MGTAVFHLKARFETEVTEEKLTEVRNFLIEASKAYDYWQANRGSTPGKFWPTFIKDYPLMTEFLKDNKRLEGDCNNGLSGLMGFGEEEDAKENLTRVAWRGEEDLITYHAEVWHFADWQPLCEFLKKKFGAVKAGWLSEEYAEEQDYSDQIDV